MSDYKVSDNSLTSVAEAIRTKGGTTEGLQFPDGFVQAISSLSTGGSTLITKSITENGTYSASSDNADGYSSVTVNVHVLFEKLGTYTVAEAWDMSGQAMIENVMTGHYSNDSMYYVFIFNNNTNTSGYRCDAIVCSKLTSSSDITPALGFMYRNYFGSMATLASTGRASQGTVIDIYRALKPAA